jgi:hypothetical protein
MQKHHGERGHAALDQRARLREELCLVERL